MLDIPTISVVVLAAGVVVAVTYYILDLRTIARTRQAQLFMSIYDRFTSTTFHRQGNAIRYQWEWSDFDDFIEKYGPKTNLEA